MPSRFFVVGNSFFILFGAWCYLARVRPRAPTAGFFVRLWVVIETLNAVLHSAWSLIAAAYIPGIATAPLLFAAALTLFWQWTREERVQPAR